MLQDIEKVEDFTAYLDLIHQAKQENSMQIAVQSLMQELHFVKDERQLSTVTAPVTDSQPGSRAQTPQDPIDGSMSDHEYGTYVEDIIRV